jgi:predicted lipoprotein with Yx(FWY)xxD motif
MRLGVVAVIPGLLLTGCGGSAGTSQAGSDSSVSPSTESSPASSSSSPAERDPGVVVTTADSQYGVMLFDGTGQAIYLFAKERSTRPECYGACAEAWPPVLSDGPPRAKGSIRAGLIDTTERRDGSTQVTYGGHPLYYYAHEGKHQVLCHGISEYGGLWLVVTPTGRAAPAG